ncbi:MAG: glycosyltransferase family 1 protein [Kiritimatiellia bacterium]|nr:glycosyltransferase family 1 protein [Kiritimatiellia bacterium]
MRIGIDARWIFKETSGIGVYTRELIRHLAQIDRQNQYVLFFRDEDLMRTIQAEVASFSSGNFATLLLDFGLFSIKNQLVMPAIIKEQNLDVFHSTNYMIPFFAFPRHHSGRTACLITIHDLIPLIFPEAAPRSRKTRFFPVYRRLMKEMAWRSDIIITDSNSSRNDIIARLPCRPERVIVIGLGVNPRFKPIAATNSSLPVPRFNRREKIILWVGRQDPYKNLMGLIEAFAMLRGQHQGPLELRLIGPSESRYPEPLERIRGLGITNAVKWIGHVSEARIVSEYQNANMLVMPSFYEGFGLPALEAMACGTPVVCSNRGSLPEVCGQAALPVNPDNISEVCSAMQRVLTDSQLSSDLISRGFQQAAKFKWQETAKQTVAAYEKVFLLK